MSAFSPFLTISLCRAGHYFSHGVSCLQSVGISSCLPLRCPSISVDLCSLSQKLLVSFISLCLRLSDETLQAGGPFYLGYMAGEVKYPAQGHTCETHFRQNDNFLINQSCVSPRLACLEKITKITSKIGQLTENVIFMNQYWVFFLLNHKVHYVCSPTVHERYTNSFRNMFIIATNFKLNRVSLFI